MFVQGSIHVVNIVKTASTSGRFFKGCVTRTLISNSDRCINYNSFSIKKIKMKQLKNLGFAEFDIVFLLIFLAAIYIKSVLTSHQPRGT